MSDADIDEVLDMIGFGRMQLIIFCSCFLQQFYLSNELLSQGVILIAAKYDLKVNSHRMSIAMSISTAGQILSSHFMGYQSDIIGRRKLLLYTSALTMCSSLISAFMPNFWSFICFRFLVGLFITGPLVCVLTYLSEFTKISQRSQMNNFLVYAMGISMIYSPAMAAFITSMNFSINIWGDYVLHSWRAIILANILPGIISFVMLYLMPESPKFYLSDNRPEEAYKVLERCLKVNKGKEANLAALNVESVTQPRQRRSLIPPQKMCCLQKVWVETKPLLLPPFVGIFALVSCNIVLLFSVGNAMCQWLPHVRHITREHNSEHLTLCESINLHYSANSSSGQNTGCVIDLTTFYNSILHGCVVLSSIVMITLLLICIRRKVVIAFYSIVSAFGGISLNFVTFDVLCLISFLMFIVPPTGSLRLGLTVLIDELPTHLRGKGVALAMMLARMGSMVANLYIGSVLSYSCLLVFNTFVVIIIISIILTSLLPSGKS